MLAILLMILNYVSNHTESVRRLQTKNERGLPARHRPPEADSPRQARDRQARRAGPRPKNSNTPEMKSERFGINLAEILVNRQTGPVKSGKT